MAVRVLRLLEYIYPNYETAVHDEEKWEVQSTQMFGPTVVRSCKLPMSVVEDIEGDY